MSLSWFIYKKVRTTLVFFCDFVINGLACYTHKLCASTNNSFVKTFRDYGKERKRDKIQILDDSDTDENPQEKNEDQGEY